MAVDPVLLAKAVSELLERHGANALVAAQERVRSATGAADPAALDLALMVLTEVERHQAAGDR